MSFSTYLKGRRYVLLGAAVVVLAVLIATLTATKAVKPKSPAEVRTAQVVVQDNVFTPAGMTVKAGTTVTWRISGNDEDEYKIAGNPAPFDNAPGFGGTEFKGTDTYMYTFSKPGTYGYRNELIPTGGGTITVVP